MLKIRKTTIYYIKKLSSGYVICKVPREGDAEVMANGIKTIQEVDKIIEEDSNNDRTFIT